MLLPGRNPEDTVWPLGSANETSLTLGLLSEKSLSLRPQKSEKAYPECSREEWQPSHLVVRAWEGGNRGPSPSTERPPWEGLFPGRSMKGVDYFDGNSSSMSSKRTFWSYACLNSTSHCLPPSPCFKTVQNKSLLGKITILSYLIIQPALHL